MKNNVNGIVLLDKPIGLSSNAALQKVKYLFQAKKAGHTGSLDPLASGMLPICFGEATKLTQFLLNADKRYQVEARLGVTTTTGDAEGEVLEEQLCADITQSQVLAVLSKFHGEIKQIPPMYSALKHQGVPLYRLARQGIEIDRAPRRVVIHALEFLQLKDGYLSFTVHCSKGTYVRTLVEDIGRALGVGAHVSVLRRLTVGHYDESQMIGLDAMSEALSQDAALAQETFILAPDTVLYELPLLQVSKTTAYYLHRGQSVWVPNAPKEGYVRLMAEDGCFLGVGEATPSGKVAPKRLLVRH